MSNQEISLIKRICEQLDTDLHYELSAPLAEWEQQKIAEIEALKLFYNMQGEEAQTVQKEYLRFQSNAGKTINQLMDIGKANDRTKSAEDKLESQNAITELAVKALEELSRPNSANFQMIRQWKEKQHDPDVQDLDWYNHTAKTALEEIKRRNHAKKPNG